MGLTLQRLICHETNQITWFDFVENNAYWASNEYLTSKEYTQLIYNIIIIIMTLSHYPSLSSVASCRSPRLDSVSVERGWKFLQVSPHWRIHESESIGKRCLWVCHYFFSNAQHFLFVLLEWFVRWEVIGRTTGVFWRGGGGGVTSRIYPKKQVIFLCKSH